MLVDEQHIRAIAEPDRTQVRRLLNLLGRDALELSGPDLKFARQSAGLTLRQAARRLWAHDTLEHEYDAITLLANLEAAPTPRLDPELADLMNKLYGLVTKPL